MLPQEAKQLHLQPMMEVRECVERKSQTRPFCSSTSKVPSSPQRGRLKGKITNYTTFVVVFV